MIHATRYLTRSIALVLTTLALLAVVPESLSAQTGEKDIELPTAQRSNAEGTRFVIGFMKNEESTSICALLSWGNPRQRIVVASRYATTIYVTLPNGTRIVRNIEPFQVEAIFLNSEIYECTEELCDNTVEVLADDPVNVYAFSSKGFTSDGYLALPVRSWGTEYVTANYYLDFYPRDVTDPDDCSMEPRGGEFAIIAAEDNTRVTVIPTVATREGYPANVPVDRVLNRGEMWMLEDGGTVKGGTDITGSQISADKPVGVLSGHVRAGIPYTPGRFDQVFSQTPNTKDHLIEMVPPVKDLGSRHIVVPFGGRRGGDIVRIVAAHDGGTSATVSTATGRLTYNLGGKGSYQELLVTSVTVIETTQDVLVAHYSQSDGVDPDSEFDPYMIVVSPEEQFSKSAVFQTMGNISNGSQQFDRHYVTIVAEKANSATLRLNGRPITSLAPTAGTVPTLENDYVWFTIQIRDDALYVLEGQAEFGGYVYGIGHFDSYGWPVGTGDTPVDIDTIPPALSAEPECGTLYWTITATDSLSGTDSTSQDKGLVFLQLDTDNSENVRVVSTTPQLPTNQPVKLAEMRITLIDRSKPGRATVVAVDAGGREIGVPNINTIELELSVDPPTFSRDSILITGARTNTTIGELLEILNENGPGTELQVDSVRLLRGVEFRMDGFGSFGVIDQSVDGTDDPVVIGFTFYATETAIHRDTLVVWIDCLPYYIPLTAVMKVPSIATDDLDFGTRRPDADSCLQMTVTNDGEETLVINNVQIGGMTARFSFGNGGVPDLPFSLEPGESAVVTICFDAGAIGTSNGRVTFLSNAASGDSVGTLIGRVVAPQLTILGHDFGPVQIGDTKCDSVPIVNDGTIPVEVTGVLIAEDLFVEDDSIFPATIQPGDTLWVPICFTPTEEPVITSIIGAENDEGIETTASLTGSGYVLLAEIDGYDWMTRWVGTTHDTIVHVRNMTGRAIVVDSIWLANGDESDFTLMTQIPPAITLAPNAEYPIDVRFSPLTVGERSIGIYARTNSLQQPIIENLLEGFGLQPIPADELRHDTTLLLACDERKSSILLYNRGNAPLTLKNVRVTWPGGTPDGTITLNAPNAGTIIPVGDTPIEIEIDYRPNGEAGESRVTVLWSFNEVPDEEFSRDLLFRSSVDTFRVRADAPPQIDNAQKFDLFLTLGEFTRPERTHTDLLLEISYDPKVTYFDQERFEALVAGKATPWSYTGSAEFVDETTVRLRLTSTSGLPLGLEGVTLPGIPFRGFFGESPLDTFGIRVIVDEESCVLPSSTALPYSITNICGLDHRLFLFGANPPGLKESRPNPASDKAVIDFTIPFEGNVSIEMYAPNGTQIMQLADGVVEAGDHTITFDLSGMTSGVYYYRMTYGTYVATRTLVVQK